MATETNKSVIQVVVDSSQAGVGAGKVAAALGGISAAAVAAAAAIAGITAASIKIADAGDQYKDLETSFKNLSESAGKTASVLLNDLQRATDGAISNAELFKAANKALSLDLDGIGVNFTELSGLVKKYADATGKDAVQSIETFTTAIATGRTTTLAAQGVYVDSEKAVKDYAAAVGTSVKHLTEQEKQAAKAAAMMRALEDTVSKLSDGSRNAGDAAQALNATFANIISTFSAGFAESDNLRQAFDDLNTALKAIDWRSWGTAIADVVGDVVKMVAAVANLASELDLIINIESRTQESFNALASSIANSATSYDNAAEKAAYFAAKADEGRANIAELQSKLAGLQEDLDKTWNPFTQQGYLDKMKEVNDEIDQQEKLVSNNVQIQEALTNKMKELGVEGKKATDNIVGSPGRSGKGLRGAESAAKEAAKAASQLGKDLAYARENAKFEGLERNLARAIESGSKEGFDEARKSAELQFRKIRLQEFADKYKMTLEQATNDARIGELLEMEVNDINLQWGEDFADATASGATAFNDAIAGSIMMFADGVSQSGNDFVGILQSGVGALGSFLGSAEGAAAFGLTAEQGAGYANAAGAALQFGQSAATGNMGVGSGAVQGAAAGAAIGSVVPGVGTAIGAVAGLVVGAVTGIVTDILDNPGNLERVSRQEALAAIKERGPTGQTGYFNLGGTGGGSVMSYKNFNVDHSNPLSSQVISLTNALAGSFGASGKLGEDISGIFANVALGIQDGTRNATNFNEAMVNVLGIMDQLDITAEEAKEGLKETFLNGQLSIEEFGADIQALNLLAQENLVGTGSISDALEIMSNAVGNPRAQLKGLELLFKEMQEVGVNSVAGIGEALVDRLGPEARDVFQALQDRGITNFENLKDRSADEIYFIISQLSKLDDELKAGFDNGIHVTAEASKEAAKGVKEGTDEMVKGLEQVKNAANSAAKAIGNLNNTKVKSPEDINKDLGA